jgi:hypothetical protein
MKKKFGVPKEKPKKKADSILKTDSRSNTPMMSPIRVSTGSLEKKSTSFASLAKLRTNQSMKGENTPRSGDKK